MRCLTRLCNPSISRLLIRNISAITTRSVIELSGPDTTTFVNGLTTADVYHPQSQAQYSGLLNHTGRILYDVIIYHMPRDRLWVESDARAIDDVITHLKKYKLRAKVDITKLTDISIGYGTEEEHDNVIIKVPDPRTSELYDRVLVKNNNNRMETESGLYTLHRLKCGVPEGVDEFGIGTAMPLEMNMDYMNGISFSKGCYLGQELISRTHHTGVVRKRVIPLTLEDDIENDTVSRGNTVCNENGKSIGKIISWKEKYAIALLRLPQLVKDEKVLISCDKEGQTVKASWSIPHWWPAPST